MQEALAMKAMRHSNTTSYVQTLTIVKAITYAAGSIMAAVSEGGNAPSPDDLNKSLSNLLNLLLPETGDAKDADAERAMKKVQSEIEKGPFKVEGMSYNKPKRIR